MSVTRFPIANVPRPGWIGICPVCGGCLAFLANKHAFCRAGHTFAVEKTNYRWQYPELRLVEVDDKTLRGW